MNKGGSMVLKFSIFSEHRNKHDAFLWLWLSQNKIYGFLFQNCPQGGDFKAARPIKACRV